MNFVTTRQCKDCKEFKAISEFNKYRSGGHEYIRLSCHKCFRAKHRSKSNLYYTTWRDKAKANGTFEETQLRCHLNQYNVTTEWYYNQLKSQDGLCMICKRSPMQTRLVVDHDHECCPAVNKSCGKCVRGLICQQCNRGLGAMNDNPDSLIRAAVYLKSFAPATTERENLETGCDSLTLCENIRA